VANNDRSCRMVLCITSAFVVCKLLLICIELFICFSVLFNHIFNGCRIAIMIQLADYVAKILRTVDVANVYDYSVMVSTDVIMQSCIVIDCFENTQFIYTRLFCIQFSCLMSTICSNLYFISYQYNSVFCSFVEKLVKIVFC